MEDYNKNEFDILDYTNVKSINIIQLLPVFCFCLPVLFPRTTTQIRFFMKNLFMKLRFPGKNHFRENDSSQGTPHGS